MVQVQAMIDRFNLTMFYFPWISILCHMTFFFMMNDNELQFVNDVKVSFLVQF